MVIEIWIILILKSYHFIPTGTRYFDEPSFDILQNYIYEKYVVTIDRKDTTPFWIRWKDVQKALGDSAMVLNKTLPATTSLYKSQWYDYDLIGVLLTIEEALKQGKISAYNKSLSQVLPKQEVIDRLTKEVFIKIYPVPEDPDYYYDSLIFYSFDEGVRKWKVKFNKRGKIAAIAPVGKSTKQ